MSAELKVLLVEDNADHAAMIIKRLHNDTVTAIDVQWVSRYSEAQSRLMQQGFEAVLLDLHLPDGEQPDALVKRILQTSMGAVIVLTALDDEALALRAMSQGVQDYLIKPRDLPLLPRSIRYAVERKRVEEALRQSEERVELALASSNAGFWDIRFQAGQLGLPQAIYLSRQYKRILGYEEHEFPNTLEAWEEHIHHEDRARLKREIASYMKGEKALFETEYRVYHRMGDIRWVQVRGNLIRNEDDEPARWSGIIWDVTEQKHSSGMLARLAAIVETSDDAIVAMTVDGRITDWNSGARSIYGYSPEEIIGFPIGRLIVDDDETKTSWILERVRRGERVRQVEMLHVRKDGDAFHASMTSSPIVDTDGTLIGVSAIVRDITERKRFESRLHHEAFHDKLTGLPNRALFEDRLKHVIARASRHPELYAVLIVDLDNFKVINDSLGHLAGDALLSEVSLRLAKCLRPNDTLARFGGDEFTILLEDVETAEAVDQVAERIKAIMAGSFYIEGREVGTGASIGVALSDKGYEDPQSLLRDADTALYSAKKRGKACHVIFDSHMRQQAVSRLKLEMDLRRAVSMGEIDVHFQPIIDVATGRVVGCEALARWAHPDYGQIEPKQFIPLAEETGLILPLGNLVLESACAELAQWLANGNVERDFYLSINLSGKQFMHPGLADEIVSRLGRLGLPGRNIRLEITESIIIKNDWYVSRVLSRLKEHGIRICMDDFGTGYSSLACLHRFPIDVLKIDRSFIQQLSERPAIREILRSMVTLAQSLEMEAIAEGAESLRHLQALKEMGFQWAQGHYFYPAKNRTDIKELFAQSA